MSKIDVTSFRLKAALEISLEGATMGDFDPEATEYIAVINKQEAIGLMEQLAKVFNLCSTDFDLEGEVQNETR